MSYKDESIIALWGKGCKFWCYLYFPKSMISDYGYLDCSNFPEGKTTAFTLNTENIKDAKVASFSRARDETPFIHIKIDSIFSDTSGLKSNVEIKFTYSFSVLEWVGYGLIKLYRWIIK